jgi:hypothetical protein
MHAFSEISEFAASNALVILSEVRRKPKAAKDLLFQ